MEYYQQQLMTYGFTVLPPELAAPGDLRERLLDNILEIAGEECGDLDLEHASRHIYAKNPLGQQLFYLLARGGPFIEAVCNDAQLEMARFLIPDAVISSVIASLKGPGDTPLLLHADQPIHPTPRSLVCTSALLLTPMSAAGGGMCFVPYSHNLTRQPTDLEQRLDAHPSLHSIEAPAGSMVIWHANTWHGAHARQEPGIRVSLLMHWCDPLLRPQEPYRELLPEHMVGLETDRFADLIGARVHNGWTEEGPERAPYAAFRTARARANANSLFMIPSRRVTMSKRPDNPPKITPADMKPGDVILSKGGTSNLEGELLDMLILALDQGDYTHSSIWDGEYVIEALTTGVQIKDPLQMTLDNQVLVDVYRAEFGGHQVGTEGWPPEPILDAARAYKGYDYGYSKLVLAGIVLLTSEIPDDPTVEIIVRLFTSKVMEEIEEWLGKENTMICSELVAQGYYDAAGDPLHKYGIPISIGDHHHIQLSPHQHQATLAAMSTGSEKDANLAQFHEVRAELARLFNEASEEKVTQLTTLAARTKPVTVIGGSPELSASFVTPGDLQRSPALKLVGTLKQPST